MGGVVERALRSLRDLEGERPTEVLVRLAWTVHFALREPHGAADVDRRFDARYGVDTGGVTRLATLRIDSEHRDLGADHVAFDPDALDAALDRLPDDLAGFSFVDLGSGKGRAVLVAARRRFRRVVGVEFSRALHRVALENVARFPRAELRCGRVELTCADAASFELPREDLVLFLNDPFEREVMEKVTAAARDSLRDAPRRLYVLYASPRHAAVWAHTGFEALAHDDDLALFGPPRAAGAHLRLVRTA